MSTRAGLLIVILLISMIFLGMVVPAMGAEQSLSITNSTGKLTITLAPCTKAGPWFVKWRAAIWLYHGKLYDACWMQAMSRDGKSSVIIIDSDGQLSQVDASLFLPDVEA